MWWSLTRADNAFGATSLFGQLIFSDATRGQLLAITPQQGASSASILGSGWTMPRSIVAHPDGTLLVADGNSAIWRVDSTDARPVRATPIAGGLGRLGQITVSTSGRFIYTLAGQHQPWTPLSSVTIPALRNASPSQPPVPVQPWLAERTRLIRINIADGSSATISGNHPAASGLAISMDEVTAYVTEKGSGALVAVDLSTGARSVVATGLHHPGGCMWLDEQRGLLVATEEGSHTVAVIDVVSGSVRHIPGCPGKPISPTRVGDLLIIAAGQAVGAIMASALLPEQIFLASPTDPLYQGGYARVFVDLGASAIPFEDIEFTIAEGPAYAAISPSKDDLFDPAHPHTMLLAGPIPGTYTLEARDPAGGLLAQAPFGVTNEWARADGPPMAFTGANPLYASGGTWGSLSNGVWPLGFTYGPSAVAGTRRVALIFVNTADTTLPAGTSTLYRDALVDGVVGADGVRRSVRAYYAEISLGRLLVESAGEATVTLPKTWAEYTQAFSATDSRFVTKSELIADAMWRAQGAIDFTGVDSAVFIVASPNGGLSPKPGDPQQFTWPIAAGGTYMLNQPKPPGSLVFWWWKSLPWVVMPAEWQNLGPRRVFETLSHEIGHTIGMTDLYDDKRDVGGWDVMSAELGLPALSLPHRQLLGWVDSAWLRTYNFLRENPVDEVIVLRASELLIGGIPTGQFAGLIVEVAEGWRYYFEYRSRQNVVVGVDPGPPQVADQGMPLDRRVVGFDTLAGWYRPPVSRKPIRLLTDDGDGEGVALAVGQDYVELDATANATFRIEVLSVDDDQASVRVRYQPVLAPEPPWPNGPDPSIRPWPGGTNWQSPDIRIDNEIHLNLPYAEHVNTIVATVTNAGSVDALGVKVGFWVKDFTISDAGPETLLGWATGDIAAGAKREFVAPWVPPVRPSSTNDPAIASVHFCIVVRIAPHAQGTPPRGEVNPSNNEAQSNFTMMWTLSGSPFSRRRVPVRVANPYPDRAVEVRLHAEQRLDWYRTYLEHTSLRLGPDEARDVEVMVECIADEPAFRDRVPRNQLYGEANIVSAIAIVADPGSDVVQPIGGATIEVHAARAAELKELDISRHRISGRVRLLSDGSAPPAGGEILVSTLANTRGGEFNFRTSLNIDGTFAVDTSQLAGLPGPLDVDVVYLGSGEVGPVKARVTIR